MPYMKLSILEAFSKADNGYTVAELVSLLNKPYKALEKRLKAYWMQYLLKRIKEGKAYRYSITDKGKSRIKYLQKTDIQKVEESNSPT